MHFVTLCVVRFSNVEEISDLSRFGGCLWFLMIFLVFYIFLILSLFLCPSWFLFFLLIFLGCFYCKLGRMLRVFRCNVSGVRSSIFNGIFSTNLNPIFNSVVGYILCCRVICNSFRQVFLRFLFVTWYIFYVQEFKDGFYADFGGGYFWSGGIAECQWVYGKCLIFWPSSFLIRMPKMIVI